MAFTPLNALSSFLAVARRRSFAAAAKDLGISKSALSQSVRQLEERLGIALLTRTSRSMALTDAGQHLLENAGPAVEQALQSLKTVTARPGEVTGRVRLTVPSSAVTLILARVLPRFVERYPKVELDVCVDDKLVDIVGGGFDAGIRLVEAIDRDMIHVRLSGPGRVVVAAAPSYIKRRGVPQKPPDLLQHDCTCMRWAGTGEPWAWELERGKKTWRVPAGGARVGVERETNICPANVGGSPSAALGARGRRRTPRLPVAEGAYFGESFFEQARLRVEDAVVERGAAERLRLDHDAAKLPLVEGTLGLHGA